MLFFPIVLLATLLAKPSKPSTVVSQQIDESFAVYNKPQSPGCSVGVSATERLYSRNRMAKRV
jgi:hypothetical protein